MSPLQFHYDQLHQSSSLPLSDGSNDFLALLSSGCHTLDIACGQGHIIARNPHIIGLDFSFTALRHVKNNSKLKTSNLKLITADAHHLPFQNQSFDLIICSGSLEHFSDPAQALQEMARVSKFQLLTVHRAFPFPFSNHIRSLLLQALKAPDQPLDQPFSSRQLRSLVQQTHLSIVYSGYWHLPYTWELLPLPVPNFLKKIPSCHFIVTKTNSYDTPKPYTPTL